MAPTSAGDGSGDGVETELSRDMSLFDITFIGVGAMIGAGVFALTGFAAGLAGPALLLAFVLNGFVALFTAASYAELGAAFPEAGGGYLWVKEALVDPNGFYAGWMSWFAHAVACSLYAVTFGVFLTELIVVSLFPAMPEHFVLFGVLTRLMVEKLLAVVMVAAFAYINFRGAEETGKAGIVVTGIKVLILGVFVVFGIRATITAPQWTATFLDSPTFAPNGIFGIVGAMGFTYIAFEGYEIIVQSGEEVVDPGTNIPKAVFYSMIIVVPIYVLVAFAAIGGITPTAELIQRAGLAGQSPVYTWDLLGHLGELGIIEAAGQFVPYGVPLLLFAGLAATMSALNATVYSSSRVSFAMGRDRALPAIFESIHESRRTPHYAIFLSAVLIAVMAIVLPIESVAAAADIMFILLFVQVNWTVIRMRKTHPDLSRTFEIPFMPWPPVIGLVLQFVLTPFLVYELGLEAIGIGTGNEGLVALVTTIAWMLLGLVVYYGYSARREEEKLEAETPTIVEETVPERKEFSILVPVANPENVDQIMRTAIDIARDHDGEIIVMSTVVVPHQTPLSVGRTFGGQKRAVVDKAMGVAEDADVPVNGVIRIGHDPSTAILNTIEQYDPDQVLLGWRGRTHRRDIVLGSIIDEVVAKSRCDVLVENVATGGEASVRSILLPTAGGPHAELAAEVARAIARTTGARVDVVHVVPPDADDQRRASVQAVLDSTATVLGADVDFETRIIEDRDVIDGIVDASADHDVTIVGATSESLVQQLVFGAIPEGVGARADGTVIMTKRSLGLRSRVRRWITGGSES
ncbi:MAG: amino acid permease [Halanaeroarchaeum sp.]